MNSTRTIAAVVGLYVHEKLGPSCRRRETKVVDVRRECSASVDHWRTREGSVDLEEPQNLEVQKLDSTYINERLIVLDRGVDPSYLQELIRGSSENSCAHDATLLQYM